MQFDLETLAEFLDEAEKEPRYSTESLQVNFFHALSMDQSCYDEETGDAGEWVRHAVLFRFGKAETDFLLAHDMAFESDKNEDGTLHIGFSVDDCGFPSVISEEEYRSIEQAYNAAMEEREREEKKQKTDDAFELHEKNGKAAYIHKGHAVFFELEQDSDASDPLKDWDGIGSIFSLCRRHEIYDPAKVQEALENNPDAVPLAYFEHGNCLWGLAEELKKTPGVEFQFDGREFAGAWVPDKCCLEDLQKLKGQKRKDKAREMASSACKAYTQYCNGEVYWYSVEIFEAKCIDGEASNDKRDYFRETPVSQDSCGGFFGYDYAKEEMKEIVVGFFVELEEGI